MVVLVGIPESNGIVTAAGRAALASVLRNIVCSPSTPMGIMRGYRVLSATMYGLFTVSHPQRRQPTKVLSQIQGTIFP